MSVQAFVPTMWSAKFLSQLRNDHVYAKCVNHDYESDLTYGSSVNISTGGDITVFDVTRNTDITAAEEPDIATQRLIIDQHKGFHFFIDDADEKQARASFRNDTMQAASYAMADVVDEYLSALIFAAVDGVTGRDLTNNTPLTVGPGLGDEDMYGIFVALKNALDATNTPPDGRWLVLPPFASNMLYLDDRFTNFGTDASNKRLRGSAISEAAGFTIYQSNQAPAGAGLSKVILAGYKGAVTYAEQLKGMKSYEPPLRFGTAVKSHMIYGAKVTRPAQIVAAEVLSGTFY